MGTRAFRSVRGSRCRSVVRGSAVYGWEFIDTEPDWETCWAGRLSLDWRGSGPVGPHTLTVFQDDARRFLELRLWFKDLIVSDPRGQPVPLAEFIAMPATHERRMRDRPTRAAQHWKGAFHGELIAAAVWITTR